MCAAYDDPDALALLLVQQYLSEQGHSTALSALEQSSGIKYDDEKPKRGSELMELVYQHIEQQQLLASDPTDGDCNAASATTAGNSNTTSSTTSSTQHQPQSQPKSQQQLAKLQEELMLRSAAADYPSFAGHVLGPLPANPLAVLMWPGEGLVAAGAADGTVRLLRFGGDGGHQQHQQQQHECAGVSTTASAADGAASSSNGVSTSSTSSSINARSSSTEVWVTRLAGAGGVLTLSWHPAVQAGAIRLATSQHHQHRCLLLAGCMDGSVHVLHAATGQVLASAKPHSKYVVAASWAPVLLQPADTQQQQQQEEGEQLIATASYDSSCCLLRLVCSTGGGGSSSSGCENNNDPAASSQQHEWALEVVQQVPFSGYVQDVCFLAPGSAGAAPECPNSSSNNTAAVNNHDSSSSGGGSNADTTHSQQRAAGGGHSHSKVQLVAAVRGTNCLNVLDVQLLRYTHASARGDSNSSSVISSGRTAAVWSVTVGGLVNMSEAGDSHVSFSSMRLALSPCNRYLLVATDSPILLLLRLSDWGVVRRMYGLDVDKFHNASIAWHRSSSYVFAAAANAAVYVYHLGTAKIVAQLRGHSVNVRAIQYDAATNRLASCSFDKTLRILEQ